MTTNRKNNLDYNVQDKKPCFNSRNHVNWTDTARQIDDPCARSEEIIAELIRRTREDLQNERN